MSCGCTKNGLTSCGCNDNCPYKTSDITVFDGDFTSIVIPSGSGLNEALEALEQFVLSTVGALSFTYIVPPTNCLGLLAGEYGYNQLFDALINAICSIQGSITNIETGITNIQTDITDIQSDITDIQSDVTDVTTAIGESAPLGTMIMYPVAIAPNAKWLLCEGQSLSTSIYADLFALIGYSFGGAGSSFNLPDLRARFVAGYSATGAAEYQTIGQGAGTNSVTLTASESGLRGHTHTATFTGSALPTHSHGIWADPNDGAASGAIDLTNDDGSAYYDNANSGGYNGSGLYIEPVSAGTPSGSVAVVAASAEPAIDAHENRPSFIVFPWAIKVLN